jgi:hypothetical protein
MVDINFHFHNGVRTTVDNFGDFIAFEVQTEEGCVTFYIRSTNEAIKIAEGARLMLDAAMSQFGG